MHYDVTFDFISIVLLGVIYIISKINDKLFDKQKNAYYHFLIAGIGFSLCNILAGVAGSGTTGISYPIFVLYLVEEVYYVIILLLGYYFYKYIEQSVKKTSNVISKAVSIISILYSALLVISPSLGLIYNFNEVGIYHQGPLFLVAYFAPFFIAFLGMVLLFMNARYYPKRHHIAHLLLFVILIIICLVQRIYPNILMTSLCVVSSALIFLFSFEAPDNLYLNEALHVLRRTRREENVARREAEAANVAKGHFLANMSHEIRTPLNVIMGLDEMILREGKEESVLEYAFKLRDASETLLGTINDILDFSKIETGSLEIVEKNYSTINLVNSIIDLEKTRAMSKDLTFVTDIDENIPAILFGDDFRLRQIITNLLSNAIKYTLQGSVKLSINGEKQDDIFKLRVWVEDTGVGIKEEDLKLIFKEFERVQDKSIRGVEGTGLGLNTASSLLKMMDSELEVESEYGKGTKFYFTVKQTIVDDTPMGKKEEQNCIEKYKYNVSFVAPEARVLIVDDKELNRYVVSSLLKDTKVKISTASGGWECIGLLEKEKFDVVLLDHMMPELDGVETLHYIRDGHLCDDTPIIVLTANAILGVEEMYLKEGFAAYLPKPIDQEILEKTLKQFLPENLVKEPTTEQLMEMKQPLDKESEEIINNIKVIPEFALTEVMSFFSDEGDYLETLNRYKSSYKKNMESILDLYSKLSDEESYKSYRIAVHDMKSASKLVGLLSLSNVAKEAEDAAREMDNDKITQNFPRLQSALIHIDELLDGINVEKGKNNIVAELTDEDRDNLVSAAEILRDYAEEFDVDMMDATVVHMKTLAVNEEIESLISEIDFANNEMDSDKVMELCNQLIESLRGGRKDDL